MIFQQAMKHEQWRRYFHDFTFPYGFYGPEDYEQWLPQAGLQPKRLELIPKDMTQQGKAGLAGWIRTTWLPYTERIPEHLREAFIDDVAASYIRAFPLDRQGNVFVKMVRLEVEAIQPFRENV